MAGWQSLEAHDAADRTHSDVCDVLRVDSSAGLSAADVSDRRHACGANELPDDEDEPLWKKFLEQFKDPMIGLLLSSAVISFIVGQWDDAISILIVSSSAGCLTALNSHTQPCCTGNNHSNDCCIYPRI